MPLHPLDQTIAIVNFFIEDIRLVRQVKYGPAADAQFADELPSPGIRCELYRSGGFVVELSQRGSRLRLKVVCAVDPCDLILVKIAWVDGRREEIT